VGLDCRPGHPGRRLELEDSKACGMVTGQRSSRLCGIQTPMSQSWGIGDTGEE